VLMQVAREGVCMRMPEFLLQTDDTSRMHVPCMVVQRAAFPNIYHGTGPPSKGCNKTSCSSPQDPDSHCWVPDSVRTV
jgi:hypothetical protein